MIPILQTERLRDMEGSDLPKVTQPINDTAVTETLIRPPPESGLFFFFFLGFYLFIFRERIKEGEREGENINWLPLTHPQLGTWHAAQACALTGN